jgi:hypothetical protein
MRNRIRLALLIATLFALSGAHAGPVAKVEQVQYPAWLDRGGLAVPLTPGTALQPADQVRTGKNARVYIVLDEGSRVKLGEGARFELESAKTGSIFRASLNVLEGAFRFTTSAVGRLKKRDVAIKVANVTAGIRGTDLWGKSTSERDIVCLIEGDISVKSDTGGEVRMNQPLQFYQKPRGLAPLPVGKVDPDQLRKWGEETEIAPGAGTAREAGAWRVEAARFTSRDGALALTRALRGEGYPAEMLSIGGEFVPSVSGLVSEAEASGLARNIAGVPGTAPRVAR